MAGLKKHFNAETTTGRANVAKVTYASIAMLYLFYRIKKKKTPKIPPAPETVAITPARAAPAPPPDNQHDAHHQDTSKRNNGEDRVNSSDHAHANGTTAPAPPDHPPEKANEAEKQHAADVLAGAVSSKSTMPSNGHASCVSNTTK